MTSLTDKMEGLFQDEHPVDCIDGETPVETYGYEETYNDAVRDCIALAKAEAAVVGDWQAEFEHRVTNFNLLAFSKYKADLKSLITTLLAAKDREIALLSAFAVHDITCAVEFEDEEEPDQCDCGLKEAYKKGFIDGGLSK